MATVGSAHRAVGGAARTYRNGGPPGWWEGSFSVLGFDLPLQLSVVLST